MRALTKEIVNTDDDLTWKAIAVTVWLVVVACPIHFTFGEQPSVLAEDSPVVISLHEGSDDLDAPFLKKKIAVDFNEHPLIEAVKFIAKSAGVPVRFDRTAVDEAGLLSDEPVTFSSIPVASRDRVVELLKAKTPHDSWDDNMLMRIDQILDLMLFEFKMTWFVEDGVLHVTTNESTRMNQMNRFYDLRLFRNQGISDDALRSALELEPDAHFRSRYRGKSRGELVIFDHVLAVREPFRAQRKLRSLLMAIADPEHQQAGSYTVEETACRKLLARQINVNLLETPLDDAIDTLAVQANARIILDKYFINKAGTLINEPITLTVKDRSLRQAFDWFLTDLKMTITVRAGELVVTSAEVAEKLKYSRVYDARTIAPTKELQDSLVSALMELTDENWGDYNYDVIPQLPMAMLENGVLIAVVDQATHNEIAKLVDFYRRHLSVPNR